LKKKQITVLNSEQHTSVIISGIN